MTSPELPKRDKERLNRLQTRLARLGYRFSEAELLKLVKDAESEKPAEIIGRAMGASLPLPETEIQRIVDSAEDMGPTSWRDIDRLLYGHLRRPGVRRR